MRQILLFTLLMSSFVYGESFLPENIYQMDEKFAHHVAIVEKSTHSLYLYENQDGIPKLLKKYKIATGKKQGNKLFQGDHKTPEGIYQTQKFYSAKHLSEKYGEASSLYGAGAFTLNYPNVIDRRLGKTGGGIWLHSTDDNSRIAKGLDSRGCVVVVDEDLKDISRYVDLKNTVMIITQDMKFLSKKSWLLQKEAIFSTVLNWAKAWKEKSFKQYIGSYSKTDFYHPVKGNYANYKKYKRAIFSRSEKPQINFSNISITSTGEYVVATLQQDYQSEVIQDIGKKTLYLKKDENYNWKIISEEWQSVSVEQRNIAFTPSMRFFEDQDKTKKTN